MSETAEDVKTKAAIVRKALVVAFGVFFFGVGLFIAIVIVVARFATKNA